ncbi:MAG: YtxH protein [Bacillales bacterium]|nr:YtxH protein [Bacillales bacterium]
MAKKFVIGAAIGGAVGAIAALLLAPKKGSELRQDIMEKADDLLDKTVDIREKGSEWVSIAVEKGSEIKDQVVAKGQGLKDKLSKKDIGENYNYNFGPEVYADEEACDIENCECEEK